MGRVLLICTGNICRSPMAEAFVRRELDKRGIAGISVESAGTSGWSGSPATPDAGQVLRDYGLDLSEHRARRLTRPMLESADLVLGLCAEHRDAAKKIAPATARCAFTMKELVYLLETTAPKENGSGPDTSLTASVQAAADQRTSDPNLPLADEDVADPLGLGLESYRITAWEIEDLSRRLVDGLFPREEDQR